MNQTELNLQQSSSHTHISVSKQCMETAGFMPTTRSTSLLTIMWLRNQSIFQLTGPC